MNELLHSRCALVSVETHLTQAKAYGLRATPTGYAYALRATPTDGRLERGGGLVA